MTRVELTKAIRTKAEKWHKLNLTVRSYKGNQKFEVHLIMMPELSSGELNGSACLWVDGQHHSERTWLEISPIYDLMDSIELLDGDQRGK